jgi:hypothetical protein
MLITFGYVHNIRT